MTVVRLARPYVAVMDSADFVAAVERDGTAFVDACVAAGMSKRVPACPGWTVSDLLWHLAEVHHFWRLIVAEQRDTWEGYEQPPRPADADLPGFFRTGLIAIVDTLRAAPPQQPNWTWASQRDAAFVVRRMAHETAVHRWDVEQVSGVAHPIDAALASDGIDEFLEHFIASDSAVADDVSGSVHIHCTDVEGEWTIRNEDGFVVRREHAKGDCAIRGAASDVLLVLWRRLPLTAAEVVGDADVATRFVAHSHLE